MGKPYVINWFFIEGTSMDEKTRIEKDIVMFEENLKTLKTSHITIGKNKIVELACQYYEDAKYYLAKQDFFTAFGCINYGHGLLDGLLKF
jgi:hypothetical protein